MNAFINEQIQAQDHENTRKALEGWLPKTHWGGEDGINHLMVG
jgi:hypothetical protein